MNLDQKIRTIALDEGADFYGVANLSPARDFILDQGGKEVNSYPKAVSLGIRLMDSIVDQLPRGEEHSVAVNYRHHGYQVINQRLDLMASRLSSKIQEEGYRALPIPASERYDDERICAVFSHKLAASMAGHGWIGKSCLLITPEFGPRVRWTTVLTDAPLNPTQKPKYKDCADCTDCVNICPVSAFTGEPFHENEPREVRFDAKKCERYINKLEKNDPWAVCGLCVYICPYGKKEKNKNL